MRVVQIAYDVLSPFKERRTLDVTPCVRQPSVHTYRQTG